MSTDHVDRAIPPVGEVNEEAERLVARWEAECKAPTPDTGGQISLSQLAREGLVRHIAVRLWGLHPATASCVVASEAESRCDDAGCETFGHGGAKCGRGATSELMRAARVLVLGIPASDAAKLRPEALGALFRIAEIVDADLHGRPPPQTGESLLEARQRDLVNAAIEVAMRHPVPHPEWIILRGVLHNLGLIDTTTKPAKRCTPQSGGVAASLGGGAGLVARGDIGGPADPTTTSANSSARTPEEPSR